MKSPVVCLLALCLGAASVHAQNASVTDPMQLIPASSRHVFLSAPPKSWVKVEYLRPQSYQGKDAGFIVLDSSQKPDLKTDWRELHYFDNSNEKDANNYRKMLRYTPDNHLILEIDSAGKQDFERKFRRDGTVNYYEQSDGNKRMAGWSISPDNKKAMAFSGGNGDLIEWDENGISYTHNWFLNGTVYLTKRMESERIVGQGVSLPNGDELSLTNTGEELSFYSMHEFWWKDTGKPIRAQVNDDYINGKDGSIVKYNFVDDEVKKRIRQRNNPRIRHNMAGEGEFESPLIKQLEQDYIARRTQFLASYQQVLQQAGQSWESLGLQGIKTPHLGNGIGVSFPQLMFNSQKNLEGGKSQIP